MVSETKLEILTMMELGASCVIQELALSLAIAEGVPWSMGSDCKVQVSPVVVAKQARLTESGTASFSISSR